ncbi:MAG: RNA-guided endonuclease IscB [Eubacteriales bacterium]|nr:RNA-guided endonuclease IscB [Eubacteriales bacterium]
MVYVINKDGQPLMPTTRHGKVRHLLERGKAKVIKRCPFTIQLLYETNHYVQEITLGVDAGSKTIGLSATSERKEYYAGEVELRNDIVNLLSTRRELRRTRRNRKTRYRKPRFQNRKRKDKCLAPSVQQKVDTHILAVQKVKKILPISHVVVEVVAFDIQKIKNPKIEKTGYQQGEQLGFWNVREYVLFRDGHVCQYCKGKSKDKILNVHHLESRKTGGDAPNNLITLCEACHKRYHQGELKLPESIKRQIHKTNSKKGIRKRNQSDYLVKGFRIFDKVSYEGKECFIYGRRSSGYFDLRTLDGTHIHKSASYKKLKLLETRNSFLIERRKGRISVSG